MSSVDHYTDILMTTCYNNIVSVITVHSSLFELV